MSKPTPNSPRRFTPRKSPYPPVLLASVDETEIKSYLRERLTEFRPELEKLLISKPILKEHVDKVDLIFHAMPPFWQKSMRMATAVIGTYVDDLEFEQKMALGKIDFGVNSINAQWGQLGKPVQTTVPALISLFNDFGKNPEQVDSYQAVVERLETIYKGLASQRWTSPRGDPEGRSEARKSRRQTLRADADPDVTTSTSTATAITTITSTSAATPTTTTTTTTTTRNRRESLAGNESLGVKASPRQLFVGSMVASMETELPEHVRRIHQSVVKQSIYLNEVYGGELVLGVYAVLNELNALSAVADKLSQDDMLGVALTGAKLTGTQKDALKLAGQQLNGSGKDWNGDDLIANVINFLSAVAAKLPPAKPS